MVHLSPVSLQQNQSLPVFTSMLCLMLCAVDVCGQEFSASQGISDAYVELNWSIPNACLRSGEGEPYPNGVY